MKQKITIKDYMKTLSDPEILNYALGVMTAEEIKSKLGHSQLPDEAVIFACRYLGAMGIALEVLPNATPEERERILDDTFDWMRLHFTEVHAGLVKTYNEKYGRA